MKIQKHVVLVLAFMLFNVTQAGADELKSETLMKTQLEGVEGTEVIVSKVYIPANTSLPRHWHPGEEFVYIMEGTATFWQEGKDDMTVSTGEVVKVPIKQVHTAITGDQGVTVLVFRVHEQGKPERYKAE